MREHNPTLIVPFTIHSSGNRSMSAQFRLEVSLHGRAWCRIDANMPWASEAVGDIISRLRGHEVMKESAISVSCNSTMRHIPPGEPAATTKTQGGDPRHPAALSGHREA